MSVTDDVVRPDDVDTTGLVVETEIKIDDFETDPLTGLNGAQLRALARLREPVPANLLTAKPGAVWCYQCREGAKQKPPVSCNQHAIKKCPVCNNRMTEAHIDLTYAGHAAATARLNEVDPSWNWAPEGPLVTPRTVSDGMWIRLTVAGVTRLGFGDAEAKTGPNAVKEVIGDAIRNAAMRFGFALELWHKGDLLAAADDPVVAEHRAPAETRRVEPAAPEPTFDQAVVDRIVGDLMNATSLSEAREVYKQASAAKVLPAPVDWDGGTVPLGTAITSQMGVFKAAEDSIASETAGFTGVGTEPPF